MACVHEQLSDGFRRWELRGRGWQVYADPVHPEPPFVPFTGHFLPDAPVFDDGRRPTLLSSLVQRWSAKLSTEPPKPPVIDGPEEEPAPTPLGRDSLVEFRATLPDKLDASQEAFAQFLSSLSPCREPIAFELIGTHGKVTAQFAASTSDAPLVRRQLHAFFPEAAFVPTENALLPAWESAAGDDALAVEFGLGREFMLPLASGKLDPFVGIVGAMSELGPGELGLFQVLFQPVRGNWADSVVRSVTDQAGRPFFVNRPELAGAAERKVSQPLFAAVVRVMVCADGFDSVVGLASDIAGSLRVFALPGGNELIPLHNEGYPAEEHIVDVLKRQSRRTGMILNAGELTGFVHLPSSAVRSPVFQRQSAKTKAAPHAVRHGDGLLLGVNEHAGETISVRLTADQRTRHAHLVGASGTGKSTLLFNLIRQTIDNGEGVAVLDPHGDLVERILGVIPPERIDDVIYFNPADAEFPIGFNILSAHSDLERTLLASDLVATFQRLSSSWGDQMNSVLQNAISAFLESDRRGTVADLRRFLIEPAFRSDFLKSVRDADVVYYWQRSFPHLSGGKSIGPILTRLDAFLAQRPIRHMVSQSENRLDFADIMDAGKILLAKLPEGLLGKENAHLLGTLLVSKFQQIAMSRQAQSAETRRLFSVFIDEFANFISPSMAEILSGARKYRMALTLAHHELHQLQRSPEVASAVMAHPHTRIVFRVGDDDARKLAEGFSCFEASDLRNLETGQAVCRVERSDFDFNLSVPLPPPEDAAQSAARRDAVITASRRKYGTPRADVEEMLAKSRGTQPSSESSAKAPATAVPEATRPRAAEPVPPPPPKSPKAAENLETPVAERPPVLRDLGRGGAQHQAIQKRIKEASEALGFRSVIEKPVLDGQGSVDLWLERKGHAIACEISISTTIDHEVRNVSKCLKAGVPHVAIICLDEERLSKIERAVAGSLGPESAQKVGYYLPDPFIEQLKSLPAEVPEDPTTVRRGYRIRRTSTQISAQRQKDQEAAAIRVIASTMKGK